MTSAIRVLMLSQYSRDGGAARAAWRIFEALQSVEEETGVIPIFRVIRGVENSRNVIGGFPGRGIAWRKFFWIRVLLSRIPSRLLFFPEWPSLHSSAQVRSGILAETSDELWDVVNLHWLGDATISIEEIGESPIPVVWTLHDMWPYCGAEHLTKAKRFVDGYQKLNRPKLEKGPDINLQTWERKAKSWSNSQSVIAPSEWSFRNASQSFLFRERLVTQIPHPIDTAYWSPIDKPPGPRRLGTTRKGVFRLGVVLHSSWKQWAKGLDLLEKILTDLIERTVESGCSWELAVAGHAPASLGSIAMPVVETGHPLDDDGLRDFYRGIDVLMTPSVMETFGLVAQEAQSCGTPVVCFSETGCESVVQHQQTGYVADHANVSSFVDGILWICDTRERLSWLAARSRLRALRLWDQGLIGRKYADHFRQVARADARSSSKKPT